MSDDEEGFDGNVVVSSPARQQIYALPPPPPNQGPPSISLAYLIDFAVQRTYQDLTVLSELLPKKSDMERKISIVQFAHSTRQLFIRLLAVVKWAKSAGKVDICTGISCFLDQQASIFVEAADRLFQLSRDVLPQARLPAFQIPAAVDVLVLGSYPRLPTCIKSRFVPDESVTLKEQACVLRRLNQVIQHRLVFAAVPLPPRMQNFTIRNGMVCFTVEGEFETSLTLLGEDTNLPWSLLNVKILVEDYDIGEGADLVHPFQVHYLHELAETRMLASENPIAELYDVLHAFCVYLHLDILFCQASKFVHDRMLDYVSVDEYVHGYKLTISYWKSAPKRQLAIGAAFPTSAAQQQQQQSAIPGFNYKLMIHVDTNDKKKALRVVHIPSADVRLPSLDDYDNTRNGKMNVENLLCDTIVVRIRHRLTQLKQRLGDTIGKNFRITGKVPTLEIPILEPWIESEKLNVAINLFTGHFVCSVALLGKIKILDEMERLLNLAQWHKIGDKLRDLKIALLMERCRKTVVGLPVLIADAVPLLPNSTALRNLSPNRLLLRFFRHESFYLIVEFQPEEQYDCKIRYFLLSTCSASVGLTRIETSGVCEFVKPVTLLLLDDGGLKPRHKVAKTQSHLVPDLAAVVTKCDQRIPFILLCDEFDRKGVKYQSMRVEEGVGCVVLNVLGFTKIANVADKRLLDLLWSNAVVSLSGRLMHDRNRLHWTFELITSNIPLIGAHQRHSYGDDETRHVRVTVLNTPVSADGAAKCADELMNAVCAFARLYDLILRFAPVYKKSMHDSCQVVSLNINRLVLAYGPNSKAFFVMLQWKQQEGNFHLSFGTHAVGDGARKSIDSETEDGQLKNNGPSAENPHSLMTSFIQSTFNEKRDLGYLVQYLSDTIDPLLSLQRLPQWPTAGVGENQMQPVGYGHVFAVLPVSGTVVRVMYKWNTCFEVHMMADGEVILKDLGSTTANTQQQQMKGMAKFVPIVGFKSYFELHEKLVGTSAANAALSQAPSSVGAPGNGGSPVRQRPLSEILEKSTGSPLKMRPDSVKTASPAPSYPTPSPAGAMIAPSPLSAPTANQPTTSMQQQGPMTPSPAPASFAGLLTPSPAGPPSNAGMLMTPSPAPFVSLQSPAPAAVQSVGSSSSMAANNTAQPQSPVGPDASPLAFIKSFASEASAAGGESKGGGGEFSSWSEFSTVASMTPVTTSAPLSLENLSIPPLSATLASSVSALPAAATPSTSEIMTSNTEDWAPSSEPIVVSHAAFRSACSYGLDGRNSLKEFLASVSTLEKLFKQLNSLPIGFASGPGQANAKIGTLEVKLHLDERRMTCLLLKVVNTVDGGDMLSDDDLRVMEQYFCECVAPVQHQHAISTFVRFLVFCRSVHLGALRSLVALMRHQLKRDTTKSWSPSLCLILPPPHLVTPYLTSIGTAAVVPGMMAIMVNRDQRKMLLWIKLVSNLDRKQQWILPLLYDGESNSLTVFTGLAGAAQQTAVLTQYPIIGEVNNILQRHATAGGGYQNYISECSIWPSINALAELLPHQQQQSDNSAKA